MLRNKKDTVFVIKSNAYSEADKIITVFGKQRGKFSLLAKGVRKLTSKNRGNIQTFSISDISYYQASGLPLLLETQQVKLMDYQDINAKNAQRILFLLNKFLPEETPSKKIFNALEIVIDSGIDDAVVNKFRMVFLKEEGILDNFDECFICKNQAEKKYIGLLNFALICGNCYSKRDGKEYIEVDKNIYSNPSFTKSLDMYIQRIYSEIV